MSRNHLYPVNFSLLCACLAVFLICIVFAPNTPAQEAKASGSVTSIGKSKLPNKEIQPDEIRVANGELPFSRLDTFRLAAPDEPKTVHLPPLDENLLAPLEETGPQKIGTARQLPEIVSGKTSSFFHTDGGASGIIKIVAEGAKQMRVHFENTDLPEGARIFVYSMRNPKEVYGPYELKGPKGDGDFHSPPVAGDGLVIEFFTPDSNYSAESAEPLFEIKEIIHDYLLPESLAPEEWACHANVPSAWGDTGKTVGQLSFVINGSSWICTGTLLSSQNGDLTPYLITANHCFSTESAAQSLRVRWLFNSAAASTPTTDGATLLSTTTSTDTTFVRLTGTVPVRSNDIRWAGWNVNFQPIGTGVVGLHHPGGAYLRYAAGNTASVSCPSNIPGGACGNYHGVNWSTGVTEGGSSGSAIFGNGSLFLGVLYGGDSSCSSNGPDYYGRFDIFYPNVSSHLAGGSDDGLEENDSYNAARTISNGGSNFVVKRTDEDFYRISVPAKNRINFSANFTHANGDIDLKLYRASDGAEVYASATTGGTETLTYLNNSTSAQDYIVKVYLYDGVRNQYNITLSFTNCASSLSSSGTTLGASGGSGSFIVNSPGVCGGWNASSNQSWATISSNGVDTLTYNVAFNNTSSTRTATITVTTPAGNLTFTITQTGCASSLSPTSANWGDQGGSTFINVTMTAAGCSWTASSNQSWLSITSGSSGTGNGQFVYAVAANTGTGSRTATITVTGGSTFTVTQDGAASCTYSLGSTGRIVDADADNFSFSVSTNRTQCTWSASVTSGASWLSITSGSGTGSGSVNFSVAANPSSTNARIGTITAAGQTYTVRQSAANVACSPVTSSLISWYRGENSTNDLIGGYDPGTFFGSVTYVTGRSSQAINFNGNAAFSTQRQIGDDFSIEFWLKTNSAGGSGETNWYQGVGLLDAEVSGAANDFGVSLGNGKILFGVGNPDTTIRSASAVNDNQWHHVVATRRKSDGSIRLYIDGVLSASGTGGTQSLTTSTQITFGKLQTGGFYVGQLDEIKIYEDDLSATQVTSEYNGCAGSQPGISIADRSLNEGNSGTTNASFTVSLSAASTVNVSVNYATQDVTATAGSDYTTTSGTLTILAGQTSGTINVPVIGDTSAESNETFKVVLSNAANATIADNEGLGTIINDDSSCSYSISPTFYIFPASAGNINISVTAPAGCQWTAATTLDWVSIVSGASGSGNGTVTIAVPANTGANTRTGVINIAGIEFSVGQQAAAQNCTYSLSSDSQTFTSSGGSAAINVTAPAGCAWTTSNPLNWVSITSGASGNGNGSTTITVQPNPSFNIRYGFVTIAGIQLFVGQEAIPTYSISGFVSYGTTPAGQAVKYVSGVQMSLTGASIINTNTSSTGAYSFTGLIGGNYTVTPTKTTQVSAITAFDATLVLRCVAAGVNCTLTANQKKAADSDNDGGTTAFDATQILRFVAANGSNSNTGQTGKWKFVQPSHSYTPLSSSASGHNFTAILVGDVNGDWLP